MMRKNTLTQDLLKLEQSRQKLEVRSENVVFKNLQDKPKYNICELLSQFTFLWWDEIGFFSVTADYKVKRIMGK
jgi:hypothetical protein